MKRLSTLVPVFLPVVLLFVAHYSPDLFAQTTRPVYYSEYLRVQDPQVPSKLGQGVIEEATLSVQPKGLFMEYGLHLTFSARGGSQYSNYPIKPADLLEVQMYFSLPAEAMITDSWLWIDDTTIVRAGLYDRWSASSIYESIVNRRRDPSILFKNAPGSYELRVYPMPGNQTRKVKITYLMPVQWAGNNVSAALPVNILRLSRFVPPLNLLVTQQTDWTSPALVESETKFVTVTGSQTSYHQTTIASATIQKSSLTLSLNAPMNNGVYMNVYSDGKDGYYQMAFLPSKAIDLPISKKIAILFDYDISKSSIGAQEVLATVKKMLQNQFSARDSFNLIFSHLSPRRYSAKWVAADPASIEHVFATLWQNPLASYSSLPALLANGLDFVQKSGGDGSLLLVANSDQIANTATANQLIKDLQQVANPLPPINIADFNTITSSYVYVNSTNYRGNEYLYINLAKLSGGYYARLNSNTFSTLLSEVTTAAAGTISVFDLHTSLKNGFCFGRYTLNVAQNTSGQTLSNAPILQVGKFSGSFPFIIQTAGLYKANSFAKNIEVAMTNTMVGDSSVKTLWMGTFIKALESSTVMNNQTIRDIVTSSVNSRVLSLYTAFLALEPNDTVKPCATCYDPSTSKGSSGGQTDNPTPPSGPVLSVTADNTRDSVFISASPNPFSTETQIEIFVPSGFFTQNVTFEMYNLLGKKVAGFDQVEYNNTTRRYAIPWKGNGNNGERLSSGVYIFVISTPVRKYAYKIILTE